MIRAALESRSPLLKYRLEDFGNVGEISQAVDKIASGVPSRLHDTA